MNSEHQALTDVPLWLLVLLSLAGLSGEMLRASGSDLGLRQILQRVALRFLASGLLGNRLVHKGEKQQPLDDDGQPIDPLIEYKQAQQKLRLTTEQADAQEMRNRVKAKKLVPVDFCLFALGKLSAMLGSTLDTIHIKVKRKHPDIEVRHIEAIQREIAVTRNEAVNLADTLPELLDEFVEALDEGAD